MTQEAITILITGIVALIVGAAPAFFLGVQYRKRVAEAELGSAEEEAKRIVLATPSKTPKAKRKKLL